MSSMVEPHGGQAAGGSTGTAASSAPVRPVPVGSASPSANKATPVKPAPAYGMWVVLAGLAAIVVVFVIAALRYSTAADVTTAVGVVSGVIAALVGAYFGIRGATLAQTNAESSSDTAAKTKV